MRALSVTSLKGFVAFASLIASVLMTGCGMVGGSSGSRVPTTTTLPVGSGGSTPTAPGGTSAPLAIKGGVHGGQQPVGNSTIQLYQVGTTGYGSAATPLITSTTVTTDSSGGFSITGDYHCTTGTYLYITASGGYSDGNPGDINNAIALGAALGLCDNLTASTFIQINEVTTVAMAYALAQFSSGTNFGTTLVNQPGSGSSGPADNFATSSTNTVGIANAMAMAQLLANTTTGTSPGTTTSNSTSGAITVAMNTAGSGYSSFPTVTFSAPPAGGTTATGIVGMSISSATITDPGQTYTSFPTLLFDAPDQSTGTGTLATGTAICDITGFDITTAGAGYQTAPTVVFSGGGATTQATATATISGGVPSVTINTPGSGYTSVPTVTISGGSPTTAMVGLAELAVTGVKIVNPGSNYTSLPTITFDGPNVVKTIATVAAATGVVGTVTNVNVTSGSGYTSAPTVSFSGGGATTQATATASVGPQSVGNTATPEWWQINLIANILAECVNTSSASSTGCTTLFSNVLNNGTAPKDTLQAALDLALNPTVPSANITTLVNNTSAQSPFQPYPSTASAVTDFSIGVEYQPMAGSTTLLNQPSAIALDSLGNAWVANQPTGTNGAQGFLVELTPTGVPIQASATAGLYSSDYLINSYNVNSAPTDMGGQWVDHSSAYQLNGLFAPAIDTSNNVWISDRENVAMVKIAGSGTSYSNSLSYTNGGTAGAVGTALPGFSAPEQTYVDGSNNVWFQMTAPNEGLSAGTGQCGTGSLSLSGTVNLGIGAFLGENTSTAKGGNQGNFVQEASANPYLVVDPNLSDFTTVSGMQTPIPGAPFLWVLGATGGGAPATALTLNYTTGSTTVGCQTPLATIAPTGVTATTVIPAITNPNLSGDTLKFMATGKDLAFDKSGNLWIANSGQIDTQTTTATQEILSSISKVTPNYGSAFTVAQAEAAGNFTFSVFHQVGSLYDGLSTYFPQFLTSDGGGNLWYTMSSAGSKYVNELSNAGTSISPYTVQTEGSGLGSTTGGYAGSICSNCNFNGATSTFQRPNALALGRPAVDQSGDVWLPINGSGSTFVDVLVGIATPKVNPDSLALSNNNFASKP